MAIKILIYKRLLSGLIALIIITGFFTSSHAATVTWTGAGADNLASNSANWMNNAYPQSGDDVIIGNSSKDCTWNVSPTLSSLITNSGYSGIITIDADLSVTGDVTISGGTLILNNGNLVTGAAPPLLPPAATSDPASNINGNAAALNATVNPKGSDTTVYFEWGMDTNYGNSTAPQSIGSGNGSITVSININHLSRNTLYHYRAVAVNSQGTSYGNDVIFTTLGGTTIGTTTISSNTTWTYAGSPYIITGNISVYGSSEPTLTIEPGVEIRFNGLYYLNIGYSSYKGRLVTQGTLSSPIIFTSNNATPAPGNWYGIRFYNHAVNESVLDYVTVNYGGYTYGGIYISNSSPAIRNSIISNSKTKGIDIAGDSSPVITSTTISDNLTYGIYANSTGSLTLTGSIIINNGSGGLYVGDNISVSSIADASFTNNGSYPVEMSAKAAGGLGTGNTFSGNVENGIKLRGATISTDTIWRYQLLPYIVTGNISVYGSSEPILTIEPGVEIRFNGLYYLNIGYSSYKGRLVAEGTSSNPILFTSNKATQVRGDWQGIRFYNHVANESVLDYVTVNYGGYNYGGIYLSNSSPAISNSTISNSKTRGIDIAGDSSPVITNTTISDNTTYGIYANSTGSLTLTGSTIKNNGSGGLYVGDTVSASSVANNSFISNGSYPVDMSAKAAGGLGTGNTFSGNGVNGIKLRGATISTDTIWRYPSVPYIAAGNISVYGTSEPVLTIEPGVEVRFDGLYYLNTGYSTTSKGRLVAQGTSSMPIIFTSNKATPAAGDWYGIRFYNHAASESVLNYVTVNYGGYNYGGIYLSNSSPAISNSTISNSKTRGIDIAGDSSPAITKSVIKDNTTYGIYSGGTGNINITFSDIINNSNYAIYKYFVSSVFKVNHCNITGNGNSVYIPASGSADARFNWWGSSASPAALVSSGVNYEPWLGAPYTYPFYNIDMSATLQAFNSPGNSVNYTFSISENSIWAFDIKDLGGTTIRTFAGSGSTGAVTWDGKDEGGMIISDGTYTYQLSSTSLIDSSQSTPLIGDVQVNNILPSAIITSPVNNQFIGNTLLNIQGTVTADYFSNYTIEYGSGAEPAAWTLIGNYTTPVNNGTLAVLNPLSLTGDFYTLRLSVNDNFANTATALVRVNLLNINSLNISPPSFSPNGDGINDMTTMTALITYPSNWTMDIKNSGGNTIKSFRGSGSSLSAVWDGKDSGGVIQPEGVYSFTITSIEAVSGATAVVTGSVTIALPDPPVVTTNSATDLTVDSATLNAAINPNGAETTVYFQWGTDTSYGNNTSTQSIGSGTSNVSVTANLTGLSRGITYHYRAVAANISGTTYGNDISFITAPQAPSDLTATVISSSQVNLSWTDNSDNESGFKIERKTGINGIYSQIAIASANITTYSDTGLTPETTYFYRVIAYNSIGDSAYSNEAGVTPTVLPIVATSPAIYITANTAILKGVINPHGSNTTYYFEWGTTASYGNIMSGFSSVNGTGNVNVSADLTGLSRGTTYHYRLVATNTYGTAYGNDMTFTTIPGTDVSGIISTNTTWTLAGSPYVLTEDVLVYGASNPTLTIEPGVEVRLMGGLFIGSSWSGGSGILKAQGTPSNPIIFTSNNPNPAPGDWMVILFDDLSTSESILEHVIIEYGGGWDTDGWTSIFVSDDAGGNLRVKDSIIRYSKGSGIQLSGFSSLTLTDSSVVNNEGNGVEGFWWGNVDITGSAISDNEGTGVYANSSGSINIANSAISNNGAYGIFSEYTVNTSIYFSTLENNAWNAVVSGSSILEIRHCNINGNGDGISSYPDIIADAGYNWWGDASGPSGEGTGIGQSIGSGINYEPWLGAPFTYPFYNMELSATLQEFSPLNNSAGYTFSVSENADWLFSVKDPYGNTVRSFSGSGTSGSVAWDGTDSGGAQVPDGIYTYQLDSMRLSDSSQTAPFIGDVVVGTGLPKAEITYPEDGQFISGSSLLDIQGTAVDSEDFNNYKLEYNAGTAPGTWILSGSYTTPVSAGILGTWDPSNLTEAYYTIRLSVNDLAGSTATATVEVKLFNIYDATVSDPSFSPNGDGYKDGTSISAYLTYPADWRVDIRDSGGNTIRSFLSEGWDYSEYYFSVGWDGRDASGNIQPGGVYSYTITATEPVSGTTAAVTGSITINLSLPTAVTDPATNVAASSATLKATVNPNESPTTAYFQWGTDISYGNNTSQQSAGSGTTNVSISTNLTGLSTGVVYHYRAVAVSANGTSYGEDRVFRPNNTTLTGVVTDASTGLAVPYVNVKVTDLFGTYSAVTNQLGAYSLTQVTEGNFTATFEKAGYIKRTVNGTITWDQTLTLDIQLTPIFISITSPSDGAVVSLSPMTVTGSVYNLAGIGGYYEALGQAFKPTTSGSLNKISLALSKVGNPNDNLYIKITTEPDNVPIAVSDLVSSSSVYSSWVNFYFSSPPAVTAGTMYYIELWREKRDLSNYFMWQAVSGIFGPDPMGWTDYYADGALFIRENGGWGGLPTDFTFKIYIDNILNASQTATNMNQVIYGYDFYPVNVTVNGIQASVSNNTFSASVPLNQGSNIITAVASDQYNHTASDTVNVILSSLPAISNITVANITTDSATITWTTDQSSDSLVEYGTTTAYGSSVSDASMTTSHSITLTNLTPGMLYHFKITSTNTYGTPSSSGDNTFTTANPPSPVISNIVVSNITNISAMITWTTGQQADSLVDYGTTALYGNTTSDPSMTTSHSITLTNLSMGTTYHFKVTSTNGYGLSSSSGDNTFTTTSPITITIVSPLDNATINRADVMVRGTVTNSTGKETGVTINGMIATVYNGQFFANHVPLTDGQNTVIANAVDTAGNTASHSILLNATSVPYVTLKANIESGIAPLTTYFSVSTSIPNSVASYAFDYEGDAVADYTGNTFDNISVIYATEGIYYPTVTATDDQGITYSDTIAIIVLNQANLDALLKAKWNAMKNALANQDIPGAAIYFIDDSKQLYSNIFTSLYDQLPEIVQNMQDIQLVYAKSNNVKYRIRKDELYGGQNVTITHYIYFVIDKDGLWKIYRY